MPAFAPTPRASGGWFKVSLPPDATRDKKLLKTPGCTFQHGLWNIPVECAPLVGLTPPSYAPVGHHPALKLTPHAYQYEAAGLALKNRGALFSHETGLGKTVSALLVLMHTPWHKALVVCPAIARDVWRREVLKWWEDGPKVHVISTGKQGALSHRPGITVVSYDLARHVQQSPWDVIILDESQYVQNNKSRRSKMIAKLRTANPNAIVLLLSATPILSEPINLWHQLNVLKPGSAGRYWDFARAYCGIEASNYGVTVRGIREEGAQELERRLSAIMHRVTKHEVAHLLPAFLTPTIRIKGKRSWNPREVSELLSSGIRKQHELTQRLGAASEAKFKTVCEAVKDQVEAGATHIVVATHLKDSARKYAEALAPLGLPVLHVDGDVPVDKRMALLERAKEAPACLLVSTMHAINVAIDLTKFTLGHLAELYWQTATVTQFLGRFSRLSGTVPSTMNIYIAEGTLDETIAHTLGRRLKDQNAAYRPGLSETYLDQAVNAKLTDEEAMSELLAALDSHVEEDYL